MNMQQVSAILRQVAAIGAIVMGCLTAALQGIHLPVALSTALTIAGGGLMWIEHYVGDTSTGSTNAASPLTVSTSGPVTVGHAPTPCPPTVAPATSALPSFPAPPAG